VPVVNVVPIPDHVSFVDAAAFPLTFLTAWHMLVTRAKVMAGETVLVLAGASGVGQAAIQLARLFGARVIATAGSADKQQRARDLGADDVIDHYTGDIAGEVRRLTGRRGVDVVVEHVGQATWAKSVRSLAPGGRLVTCGNTTGWEAAIDLRFLFSRQLSLLGSYMGTKAELLQAAPLFFAGRLRPLVDAVMPLEAAADAQRRLEAGEVSGKLVLTP
jgi:NADPH:quinone reductase-like Zn-dependent oxidoreductase